MLAIVRNFLVAGAFVLTLAVPAGVQAQLPTGAQVALTPQLVEAFVASFDEVATTADNLSDQYGVSPDDDADDPATAWQAWLAVTGAQGALNAICQSYGFSGFMQWVQVMTSVSTAYAFATGGADMSGQLNAAIAQIQSDPNIPAAQKQMLIQQMQASMGAVAAMAPPQQNIDAAAPYIDQLDALFGNN